MAAPIRPAASGGAVAGVVSLAAPSLWLTEARMQRLLPHLLRTAAEMAELWPLRARIAHPEPLETA
jgi:DNA-binding IclR family transcriptional regulator